MAAAEEDINHHMNAAMVVIDVYPQMIREMIVNHIPPKTVLMLIQNDADKKLMKNITSKQKDMILKLDTAGYKALDLSCLYKVVRHCKLLNPPKQGWDKTPKPEDQSEGDDLERMKKIRNAIFHRPRGGLSESEINNFFQQSIEIATRVDIRIGSPSNGFKRMIEEIKSKIVRTVNPVVRTVSPEKYMECLEKLAECREKIEEKERPCVILYYANSIAKKIGSQYDQDIKKKDVTVALIKPDVVEAGKVNQMLKDIREAGIEILRHEERMLTEDEIRHQVYSYLENQDFFEDMVQFMTRSPSFVLALTRGKTGQNIIENFRDLIGPTDVDEAKTLNPDSLRAKYGQTSFRNAVHGSSSLEMVKRDLHLFFPDFVAPDVEDKGAKLQTTLALLRPKAVPYKDTILAKIRDSGFKIAMQKEIQMSIEMVKDFYKGHQGQNFYDQLIENMSSGPVLALGLIRENAVEGWRNMLGPKEVSIAKEKAPESLRAQFAEDDAINSLHGSDSQETANKEIQLFFPTEQTVAVIKPHAIRNKKEIVARISEAGFRIAITKTTKLPEDVAKKFYANCENKDYYIDLIEHMKSGEAYFIGMCREGAVEGWRSMIGPSDPAKAKKDAPDSIRATYGESIIKNAVHGSSDPEHAKRSIKTIFGDRSSSCTIVLRDLDFDDEAVMQIKKLTLGNICTEDIELMDITQGSLILHVRIPDWCFMTTEILHERIHSFLHQFLILASIPFMHGHFFTVVLAESDDLVSDNDLTKAEDLDYLRENTLPILKFNVNIQDSVFQDEFVMHREVNRFFFRMYNAIDAHDIPVNGSAKEVLMLTANENGENFSSSSATILDSQLRTEEQETSQMMTKEPVVSEMMTEDSVVSKIMTERPVISERMTKEPEFREGNTEEPDIRKMMVIEPVLSVRMTEKPDVNERMTKELGVSERITEEQVVEKKMTAETILSEPFPVESVVSERMTEEPVNETWVRMAQKAIEQIADLKMAQEPIVGEMESNYFRISTLFKKIAPRAVRIKFDDTFPPKQLKEILDENFTILTYLKDNKTFSQIQWDSMFPRTDDPTSESFDISLMIHLFRNLDKVVIINHLPHTTDVSVGADLSRIRIYRKDVTNSEDRECTNAKFTAYWDDTEAAVIRLSGGKLKEECHNLKTMPYNLAKRQTDRNIAKAGKSLAQIEDINDDVDRFEKIDLKQNSDEKRDCSGRLIEEWEEEKNRFVQTNAFNFVRKHLDEKVLTIVGNPGIGKSILLHQTAIFLRDTEGYSIIPCYSPTDIVNNFKKERKQVFIFDDVFGRFTLVQPYIDRWKQYEIRIERISVSKNSIILVSCRSQVYTEKQCKSLIIFSKCLCNMNDVECSTDSYQKLEIADKYLNQETISKVKPFLNFDMFPLLCRLYKDRENWSSISFFKDPFTCYKEELDSFYTENDRIKRCSLFLCVIHNGCFNQAILMEESESDFSRTLETIFATFKLDPKMNPKRILDGLDTLLNTYLTKRNGQFHVLHDRLFDFLCSYFGNHYQHLIINYADSDIIRDRTLFKSLETCPHEFAILIDTDNENEYMKRLIRDMLSGYIDDVLYNHQIRYEVFRKNLLAHFKKLDDDDLRITRVLCEFVVDENVKRSKLFPVNFTCKYGYTELFTFFLSKTKDVNAYVGNNIPLITACRKGDNYMTGLLLEKGANVNQTDSLGCSPLLWACVYGNLDIVQMLLHYKADIENIEVCCMSSPLIWACFGEFIHICNSVDLSKKVSSSDQANDIILFAVENLNDQFSSHEHLIEFLLTMLRDGHSKGCTFGEENVFLNKKTPELPSVLKTFLEIINGEEIEIDDDVSNSSEKNNSNNPFIEIMDLFLDRGIDIDKTSTGGITALFVACMFGIYKGGQSISYLLSKGASINKSEIDGKYPLHVAVHRVDIINTLVKYGSSVNCEDASGNTPLMMAVNLGLEKNVLCLINERANVNKWNSNYVTPLMNAVHKQNIPIVNTLIEHKADINIRCRNGETLLHHAIQFNNVDLINTLLKAGISVNCTDGLGNTSLMIAVIHGLDEICVILIKEGANVNTWNSDKETPLMHAVDIQNINIVNILIEHKADINVHFRKGSTLLHRAIQFNNTDLIKTLLKTGMSVNCEDGQGNTPLMIAVDRGLSHIAYILVKEGAKVDTYSSDIASRLMTASSNGDVDIVKMILTKTLQFNNYLTIEPLFSACNNSHQEVVSLLLQKNCDINIPRTNGNTCLFDASEKGLDAMVSFLLEQGAIVNASNDDKDTPLTVASMKGHTAIVRLLIAGKADMYKSNKNGESALILAGLYDHLEVVIVLIDNGCNIESFENETKQTCLSVASYRAYDKIVTYLIEQGANVNTESYLRNTPLMLAAAKGHLNIVRRLIEHEADVNIRNEKGSTSLSLASSKGFDKIVAFLIEHGANVNTQSCIGTTPIILAASKGHLNIVKKLIEYKADVNIQNEKGSTCLSVASSKGFSNIVTYLLFKKASINTANSDGDSPLMLASKNGHISTVKILLENGANVDMKNKDGLAFLDLALKSKHVEIAEILCEFIQQNSE